jgi:hypothetical protein
VTEYVSGELGGKIKAIICEWSKRVKGGTEAELHPMPPFPCREIWARRNPHVVFGPYPVGRVSGDAG